MDLLSLGERIKDLRVAHELTIKELSKKVSISEGTISKIENIDDNPGYIPGCDKIAILAEFFNVTCDYLLDRPRVPFPGDFEQGVGDILGLLEPAQCALKDLKNRADSVQNQFAIDADNYDAEREYQNILPGTILDSLNALLSSDEGLRLIELIYKATYHGKEFEIISNEGIGEIVTLLVKLREGDHHGSY